MSIVKKAVRGVIKSLLPTSGKGDIMTDGDIIVSARDLSRILEGAITKRNHSIPDGAYHPPHRREVPASGIKATFGQKVNESKQERSV
ncbi:MAG: hypothetical protein V4694_03515 [Pseudomonadota bacterium]